MDNKNIAIISEQGDMGLHYNPLSAEEAKILREQENASKEQKDDSK